MLGSLLFLLVGKVTAAGVAQHDVASVTGMGNGGLGCLVVSPLPWAPRDRLLNRGALALARRDSSIHVHCPTTPDNLFDSHGGVASSNPKLGEWQTKP